MGGDDAAESFWLRQISRSLRETVMLQLLAKVMLRLRGNGMNRRRGLQPRTAQVINLFTGLEKLRHQFVYRT